MAITPPQGLMNGLMNGVWSAITNGGSSDNVPDPFIVAINGHDYLHDLEFKPWKRQAMRATTTTTTRTQADSSNEPGEQSLSTEQLWRRTQDSWHEGAGQVYYDRDKSTDFGFRQSFGVDVWTQWQLSLLPTTKPFAGFGSTNDNLYMTVCGSHLYVIDGDNLYFTPDLVTFTLVTGTPALPASSICSDGHNVWVAYGADGVYTTTEAASAATQYVTDPVDAAAVVRYTLGRLMLGSTNKLYNIVGSGALPSPLMVSDYSNLTWCDVAQGNGCIFAAGNSGNIGLIYSVQIETDGTSLSSPTLCGQLPPGENVNAIYGYAGSGLAIGTSLGFRWSEQALANSISLTVALNIGPIIYLGFGDTPQAGVTAFSGYDRFIWASYENFDADHTGLFRIDPTVFVNDLAPAVATDIMAGVQGPIVSVVHLAGLPVFSIAGVGWYYQSTSYEEQGWLESGLITYGLADNKRAVFVDYTLKPLYDDQDPTPSNGVGFLSAISLDGGEFKPIGAVYTPGVVGAELATPQTLAKTIEIQTTLQASGFGDDFSVHTPFITGYTLRGVPVPAVPTDWQVVLQLREKYLIKDIEKTMVPSEEYNFLDQIRATKQLVTLQVGNIGPFTVTIESIDWIPEQNASLSGELNGVAVVTCRTVV